MRDFWVFGYGSLMWNPGFEALERLPAKMHGVHRALCVHSWVHRGTQDRPGLVLGLDRGGSCHGVAFRVAPGDRDDVLAYLRQRELVTQVYLETWRKARLSSGGEVSALVYVVDRGHPQYAGRMPENEIASIVRSTEGRSGRNLDYVLNTIAHLRESGVHDPHLEAVAARL
jgi:glutathione-specific gamma-glutamylcyclotransferase